MAGKKIVNGCPVVVLFACLIVASPLLAQQSETQVPPAEMAELARLTLLEDVVPHTAMADANVPVPFASSSMAADAIPPFAAYPVLDKVQQVSWEEPISFEENIPVKVDSDADSIDNCCEELTAMIAGNLNESISVEAKTKMVETALKMVARNVQLKAEAEITKLKADHALEMARMQSQMMQMRSTAQVAQQIDRIAAPLQQSLARNEQLSAAAIAANQEIAGMLAQAGYAKLQQDASLAQANRKRIQLTSRPEPIDPAELTYAQRLDLEMKKLQRRLEEALEAKEQRQSTGVQAASYHQPLQPRANPLEPIRRENRYFPRDASYPSPARSDSQR